MTIKNKILSLAGVGTFLSQLIASRVLAQENWRDWMPDYGNFTNMNVMTIVSMVIRWALILSAIVAVIFIIWGGYQYVTSSGDAEKAGKGRATLINAIIGLVIIFVAYAIVVFVFNRINTGTGV